MTNKLTRALVLAALVLVSTVVVASAAGAQTGAVPRGGVTASSRQGGTTRAVESHGKE